MRVAVFLVEPFHLNVISLSCLCDLLASRPSISSRASHTHVLWLHFAECYSLDGKYPCRHVCLNAWSPAGEAIEKVMDPLRGGGSGSLGAGFKDIYSHLTSCFLATDVAWAANFLFLTPCFPLQLPHLPHCGITTPWNCEPQCPFPSICVCWGIYLSSRK